MSSEPVIALRGVGKAYPMFKRPQDRLRQMLWRGRRKFYEDFWAVHGVDLDIYRGETVGIVGRNGSGKSTLLQLVCGTLQPSCGRLVVRGRIAALLELGAGFNPEFTGRENVFMSAAILGLTDAEIESRYDAIVAFADIGNFITQPVKSYSSGMYARLAFAVAIHVDPDVLVIDEALSVGDEAFQRKCFSRIQHIRAAGATVLFVSHSAASIVELCDRAVLLDRGERLLTGTPKAVIAMYQKLLYAPPEHVAAIREQIRAVDRGLPASPEQLRSAAVAAGCDREEERDAPDEVCFDPELHPQSTVVYAQRGAEIRNVRILNAAGKTVNVLSPRGQYVYAYEVAIQEPAFLVRCGMMVRSITGLELAGLVSHPVGHGLEYVEPGTILRVRFRFQARLAPGTYFLNAGVVGWQNGQEIYLHRITDVLMAKVSPVPNYRTTGYVDLSVEPLCEIVREDLKGGRAEPLHAEGCAGSLGPS
jgi:lipopolysaccharide transport system ATP-binding protein